MIFKRTIAASFADPSYKYAQNPSGDMGTRVAAVHLAPVT
jgi:hypothetical protein